MSRFKKVGRCSFSIDQLILSVLTLQLKYAQITLDTLKPQTAEAAIMMPADYKKYAWDEAVKYGVDPMIFTETLQCESKFNHDAVGDHGTSIGIAQIHLPAHPDVSYENATDGIWSIDWAAKEFAAGRAYEWTCWKAHFRES